MFGCGHKKPIPPQRFDPSRRLFYVTPKDVVTLGNMYEGCLVMGATGSGKSSGPMNLILDAQLKAGVGMLVLTAKSEYAEWQKRCRRWGRECIRMAPDGHRLDVLQAALAMPGSSDEAAAVILDTLADVGSRSSNSGTGESYWVQGNSKNFRRCIAISRLGLVTPTLRDVAAVFNSLPKTVEEACSVEWATGTVAGRCMATAEDRRRTGELCPADRRKLEQCGEFIEEWAQLSDRTRSVFVSMSSNIFDKFVFGEAGEMVASGESTFSLDDVLHGAVVVIDYPSLVFGDPARFAQIAVKTLVQQAILKRKVTADTVPVAIVADEYQQFCTSSLDCVFQAVARSARGISLFATQSIPLLMSELGGGPKAEREVEALVGNLQTRFVCQNTCSYSNEFFSRMCGEFKEEMESGSAQLGDYDPVGYFFGSEPKATVSYSTQYRPQFPAWQFGHLAKGGPAFRGVVESVVLQGGRIWSNGLTWTVAKFRQSS